jgi:murein DD-endopeptidase MepM/ murein hydrolase activator NlpD
MSSRAARVRAPYVGALVALCLLTLTPSASADDGSSTPPRAAPLARAIPRTFYSYEALLATARAVASDQIALDGELASDQVDAAIASTILAALLDPRRHGGLVGAEATLDDEPALAALRVEIAAASAGAGQLIAAGATAAPPAAVWLRPISGPISQPFGPTSVGLEPARVYDGTFFAHFHDGIDVLAAPGTAVIAPARARVVFAGRMPDGAEVVVLAHDDGLVSLYAHLEDGPLAPSVKAGDIIEAGERIGSVGLTGTTTGYHLHWAVYRNGEPIDPLSTLVATPEPPPPARPPGARFWRARG